MVSFALNIEELSTDEIRNVVVSFANTLDSGEVLTGTPTIQCDDSLTITNERVNTSQLTLKDGTTVAIGKAVQFTLQGSTKGRYLIESVCETDAGQVVEGGIYADVTESSF